MAPSAGTNVKKMVPAKCCSFPFTYNGQLYHKCAQNATDAVDVGCFLVNRTWVGCLPPTGYAVSYKIINITVFNFTGVTPLMSINNWIIIQQRLNATPTFSGLWADYKRGFGNITGNFWLGLEKVHQLTNTGSYRLRIELETLYNGTWFSIEYDDFIIGSEINGYSIKVNGYSGDGGDGFNYYGPSPAQAQQLHNGMKFTTTDKDNDNYFWGNCAQGYGNGGFWYDNCLLFCFTCSTASGRFIWRIEEQNGDISGYELRSNRMMMKLV